jgi:hypothetical protein
MQIAISQKVSTNREALAEVMTYKGDGEDLQPHVISIQSPLMRSVTCVSQPLQLERKGPWQQVCPKDWEYGWGSNHGLAAQDVNSLQICSTIDGEAPRGFEADYIVVDAANLKEVQLCIEGLRLAFVSDISQDYLT